MNLLDLKHYKIYTIQRVTRKQELPPVVYSHSRGGIEFLRKAYHEAGYCGTMMLEVHLHDNLKLLKNNDNPYSSG